jgi:hypothetical protein
MRRKDHVGFYVGMATTSNQRPIAQIKDPFTCLYGLSPAVRVMDGGWCPWPAARIVNGARALRPAVRIMDKERRRRCGSVNMDA